MKYLRINKDGSFCFPDSDIHTILNDDIEISRFEYEEFFRLQNMGKEFKLKEYSTGPLLFDYVEEFVSDPINYGPTDGDRIKAIEMALLEVL